MKVNDIMKLIDAGFTKEDILTLAALPDSGEETKTTEDVPQNSQPIEEPKPEPAADKRVYDDISAKLDKITSGIESIAVRGSRMPERETAEEALAKIINPYLNNKEE